jgi:predicted peptidase
MSKDIKIFLAATLLIACVVLVLLYSLWGYLKVSSPPAWLYRNLSVAGRDKLSSPIPTLASTPTNAYLGYTSHVFSSGGNSLTYYFYMPANYNPNIKYPLVLVLQGGGERSKPNYTPAQNEKLLLTDPYALVWSTAYNAPDNPQIQKRWPSFVVVPQIQLSQNWVNVNLHLGSYTQPAQPSIPLLLTKELLDALQREYSGIDANRLYITGLSNGGLGTWDAIERWPDYFAAAAPICGAGDPSKAAVLRNLPIWAFHGSADTTIPVSGSRDMIAAIQAAGGHPKYTEFAGKGHGVWPYVYSLGASPLNVAGFYPWLFAQHK